MPAKMDLALTGTTFTDYELAEVGSAAFELEHDFWIQQDLVIRTASGGGGTLLVEGAGNDYILSDEDTDLSTRVTAAVGATRNVYREIQIINASYQTGDLYFSGKYVGDANEAADIKIPKGYLVGLELANNATDANNDIDIAVGECVDSDGEHYMELSAVLTKQLDAAWAVGDDAGGLDTGSKAVSTTYHVHLIRKKVDGTIDALFSLSATAPTMPSGYTARRRLGAVLTDGSGNIIEFHQDGDEFMIDGVSATTTFQTALTDLVLPVPTGLPLIARLWMLATTTASGTADISVVSKEADKQWQVGYISTTANTANSFEILTDSAATIQHGRTSGSGTAGAYDLQCSGWRDSRGRHAA